LGVLIISRLKPFTAFSVYTLNNESGSVPVTWFPLTVGVNVPPGVVTGTIDLVVRVDHMTTCETFGALCASAAAPTDTNVTSNNLLL
jgi:hypothetical protein